MSSRRIRGSLEQVVAIRDLQLKVEEQALARATVELDQLTEKRSRAAEQAEQALAEWDGQLRAGPLNPVLAGAFGHALLAAEDRLVHSAQRMMAGENARQAQAEALQHADARRIAAEQLRDETVRRARRRVEEERMNDQADRATLRSWRRR
jgi:hypothetical protein